VVNTKPAKSNLWPLILLFVSAIAFAAGISINANSAPYNSQPSITSVNYSSDSDIVSAGMTAAVGLYRTNNGATSAPVGTPITVTWTDNSVSHGVVQSTTSSFGVLPSGNPTPAGNTGGSGGSGNGNGGGTSGGANPPGPGDNPGVVTVGPDHWT
jgi:hypothetical protein